MIKSTKFYELLIFEKIKDRSSGARIFFHTTMENVRRTVRPKINLNTIPLIKIVDITMIIDNKANTKCELNLNLIFVFLRKTL